MSEKGISVCLFFQLVLSGKSRQQCDSSAKITEISDFESIVSGTSNGAPLCVVELVRDCRRIFARRIFLFFFGFQFFGERITLTAQLCRGTRAVQKKKGKENQKKRKVFDDCTESSCWLVRLRKP